MRIVRATDSEIHLVLDAIDVGLDDLVPVRRAVQAVSRN
jgi:hypothetical protein